MGPALDCYSTDLWKEGFWLPATPTPAKQAQEETEQPLLSSAYETACEGLPSMDYTIFSAAPARSRRP